MKVGSLVRFRHFNGTLSSECYVVLEPYDTELNEVIAFSPKHMIRTKLLTCRLERVVI